MRARQQLIHDDQLKRWQRREDIKLAIDLLWSARRDHVGRRPRAVTDVE